jgi:putative addiction module component (TIGR02574 family)
MQETGATMELAAYLEGIRQLSANDRMLLLEALWNTFVDDPTALSIPPEHIAELDRRLDDMERNPQPGIPWEDFKRTWMGEDAAK